MEKLVIVPRTCHFDLPPTWRHLTRGDVDPGCDDHQQQQQVCEFGIRQNRVHEHNRTKPIRKDVFRLTRERDGKSYDVVYDFPFILKSTLGNALPKATLFLPQLLLFQTGPTKGVGEEYRRAEVEAFLRLLRERLRKSGRRGRQRVKVFVYEGGQRFNDSLEDMVVDFLEEEERKDLGN